MTKLIGLYYTARGVPPTQAELTEWYLGQYIIKDFDDAKIKADHWSNELTGTLKNGTAHVTKTRYDLIRTALSHNPKWDKILPDKFGDKKRITLDISGADVQRHLVASSGYKLITALLEKLGYIDIDYANNTARDSKKNPVKLTSILAKLSPKLSKAYTTDNNRTILNTHWVISRHPFDLLLMSTGRQGWDSCMNWFNGQNKHYVPTTISAGAIIAYWTSKEDERLERPMARRLIKRFELRTGGKGVKKADRPSAWVLSRNYGLQIPTAAERTIEEFVATLNVGLPPGTYHMVGGQYNDGENETIRIRGQLPLRDLLAQENVPHVVHTASNKLVILSLPESAESQVDLKKQFEAPTEPIVLNPNFSHCPRIVTVPNATVFGFAKNPQNQYIRNITGAWEVYPQTAAGFEQNINWSLNTLFGHLKAGPVQESDVELMTALLNMLPAENTRTTVPVVRKLLSLMGWFLRSTEKHGLPITEATGSKISTGIAALAAIVQSKTWAKHSFESLKTNFRTRDMIITVVRDLPANFDPETDVDFADPTKKAEIKVVAKEETPAKKRGCRAVRDIPAVRHALERDVDDEDDL